MKPPTLETVEAPALAAPRIAASEEAQIEAHAKESFIDIPVNLENWKDVPEGVREQLLWFHQFVLDNRINWARASEALDYDQSVVYRVLKGTYSGNWGNVCKAIVAFRKREETPLTLRKYEFVENSITKVIFNALSYAKVNGCIVVVEGESGQGKSVGAQAWKRQNNHGKTVMVIAPAFGGVKALLSEIGIAVGINKYMRAGDLHQAILRAFNKDRMLVVDEAHRLLPPDRRTNPFCLEILRDIHDRTGCALGLIATARFNTELRKGEYMFEQLIGRSMPVRLPRKVRLEDVEPIVRQFVPRRGPTRTGQNEDAEILQTCMKVAEQPGRLRIMVEVLKGAQRIAEKHKEKPGLEHLLKAIRIREEMQGETIFAK